MFVIEVDNVSKVFSRTGGRKLLRQQIADMIRTRGKANDFHALRNVSFKVAAGEAIGIVGVNGAGKSTLLNLVAGVSQPTSGSVKIGGRVAALLELGSGFHPELTGKENIFVNAALLGYAEADAKARFDEIVEFADIGSFISEPVRTYSSGMQMRLAFSIAVHIDPAVLITDEVLAVGDAAFQEKCLKKVSQLRKNKMSMLCVSHSPAMISNFCDRAIWLHAGEVVLDGPAGSVAEAYARYVANPATGLPRHGMHLIRPTAAVAG